MGAVGYSFRCGPPTHMEFGDLPVPEPQNSTKSAEPEEEDPFDVELGEIVEFERPIRPPGVVDSIRLDHEYADQLCAVAEASGRTLTQVATDALRAYLDTATTAPIATKAAGPRRVTAKAT